MISSNVGALQKAWHLHQSQAPWLCLCPSQAGELPEQFNTTLRTRVAAVLLCSNPPRSPGHLESKPKSVTVHEPLWDLALSYTLTSPTSIVPSLMLCQSLWSFKYGKPLPQWDLGPGFSFSLPQSAHPTWLISSPSLRLCSNVIFSRKYPFIIIHQLQANLLSPTSRHF